MEMQLASVSHTERITSSKELAVLFPEKMSTARDSPAPIATDTSDAPTKTVRKLRPRKQLTTDGENDATTQEELSRLRTHANQLVKAMQSAVKTRDPLPLTSSVHRGIDGVHLVHRTSWGWRSVSANSRHREFPNVAGSAVLEWGIIEEYRPQLLAPGSGANYLRGLLIQKLSPMLKSRYTMTKQKAEEFTFTDQVAYSPDQDGRSFQINECLSLLRDSLSRRSDAAAIQSLVKTVERCPLAWRDPDGDAGVKSPPVDPAVQRILEQLVKVRCLPVQLIHLA